METLFWARLLQTVIFSCLVAITPIGANQLQGLDDDMEIGSDDIKNYFDDQTDSFLQRTLLQRRRLKGIKTWTRRASKRIHDLNEYTKFRSDYLNHVLHVRVPGTEGHEHVKNFLKNSLEKFGWTVELDEFSTDTPVGVRTFTNIMGILHPKADRRLALVAHYDSKDPKGMDLGEGQYFMGATDSAVPCAMLLDFAQMLGKRAEEKGGGDVIVSPMIIFLDGEEAFREWSDKDSLYGSRHLAQELDSRPHPNKLLASKDLSVLDSLDAFVLFDLIGAKNPQPQFFELYPSTHQMYKHLQDIEDRLKTNMVGTKYPYFPGPPSGSLEVEDDHKPFLLRGVPILHLVSIPFPDVWHKLGDNESALDEDTIVNLLQIFRQWLKEHFDMNQS